MWRHVVGKALNSLVDLFCSKPERVALRVFREKNPEFIDAWSTLVGREGDRFVVGIFFGRCEPPQYKFFAVTRDLEKVEELRDDSGYRPRGWR